MYVQAAGWEVAAAARKAAASKVSHDPAMSCEKKKIAQKKGSWAQYLIYWNNTFLSWET
jgi:hypothetical protein